MLSVQESCEPNADLIAGTFNPEVFTAVLSQVLDSHRGRPGVAQNVYTDPVTFFTEATYATQGLRDVLAEVFGRLAGDGSIPAIHRLETAFGGGKTHALIACAHLGFRGSELARHTEHVIDAGLLPNPGEVAVVGIGGDEIPVHKPQGAHLVPYTLWGEIAYQVGSETLYRQVEDEATSHAAPGRPYFDRVLGGRKAVIMLDELAQYATRLEAARPTGSDQLAAFLMALHGYARSNAGISVILTLASQQDAFATQTRRLTTLVSEVRGEGVSEDEAMSLRERAEKGLQSVVARDASPVTPVHAAEISRVLATRLFTSIDATAAKQTAEAFAEMYTRNAAMLPDTATRPDYVDRMVAHYPFHPTLIDFLNAKLSTAETFQGTRGVLRALAVAVRDLWQSDSAVPMIQTCHLNLRNRRIVGEVLGRTGSNDLLSALDTDVGGVDTDQLEGGQSNAEMADNRNPHPLGYPMYEWTWRVVFLHSLVGRDQGVQSQLFGLTEAQALFETSFPGLTPPQAQTALQEISESAFYLRSSEGKYYASLDPSLNAALARLRRSLAGSEAVANLLDATARKVVTSDVGSFQVVHDVSAPEHVSDNQDAPVLALVSLSAGEIDVDSFIRTVGENRTRIQQNTVFLLVPETVVSGAADQLFSSHQAQAQEIYQRLQDVARWVVAMRRLKDAPDDFGINRARLDEQDFGSRHAEREQALVTTVTQAYSSLWYPSASGQTTRKEIRTAGGEGGESTFALIRKELLDDDELLTEEHTTQTHLANLAQLYFAQADTVAIGDLRQNFWRLRHWPVLARASVFDQVIRAGVSRGAWCLFRMGGEDSVRPAELYGREGEDLPYDLDLTHDDYMLVTPQGANQRGWMDTDTPDQRQVVEWVRDAVSEKKAATVAEVVEQVVESHGTVALQAVKEAVTSLAQDDRLAAYDGDPSQTNQPELITGTTAALYTPSEETVILTIAEAAQRGWITEAQQMFRLQGADGAAKLVPLLRRIGSLYNRGAKSSIQLMDLFDLGLSDGGSLRIQLENVTPEGMKALGEMLEVLAGVVGVTDSTGGDLEIADPDEECLFLKELTK